MIIRDEYGITVQGTDDYPALAESVESAMEHVTEFDFQSWPQNVTDSVEGDGQNVVFLFSVESKDENINSYVYYALIQGLLKEGYKLSANGWCNSLRLMDACPTQFEGSIDECAERMSRLTALINDTDSDNFNEMVGVLSYLFDDHFYIDLNDMISLLGKEMSKSQEKTLKGCLQHCIDNKVKRIESNVLLSA